MVINFHISLITKRFLRSFDRHSNTYILYLRMLTFCVTAIIYYIIINSANAFIKSTNKIYHNCVYQGAVYDINQICQGHILIPTFEVSIYVPIKVCNCNKYSFNYS